MFAYLQTVACSRLYRTYLQIHTKRVVYRYKLKLILPLLSYKLKKKNRKKKKGILNRVTSITLLTLSLWFGKHRVPATPTNRKW